MGAPAFISRKLKFQGRIAVYTIAIASFIIIIAVAVSSGFRHELRAGIAGISGDVQLTSPYMDYIGEDNPIPRNPGFLSSIDSMDCIRSVTPAVYRAGIVKSGDNIHGVIFKGVPGGGDSLYVSVPKRLGQMLGLSEGDPLLTYFISSRVKARKFRIREFYDDVLGSDDNLVVYAGIGDMQRVNGWNEDEVSALEIVLKDRWQGTAALAEVCEEIGARILFNTPEDEDTVIATSAVRRFPQIFTWLDLIDFNVLFVLVLMVIVAGFNMISALLIMLFRNIRMIGILKSVGMSDRDISSVFLRTSSSVVIKGMAAGNAAAFLFCILQGTTHFLHLNPENYFVSWVPVHVNLLQVLAADAVSYLLIMVLLLLPCLFVSHVDPAKTVRAQ